MIMKDLLQYILDEVKNKRLKKADAIDLIRQLENNVVSVDRDYLHPLLHKNTSDFSEQRFSSTFTGQEFFISDHLIKGRKVLPELACLEMARKAAEQASGTVEGSQMAVLIKNVEWNTPIVVDERPVNVHIGLIPEDNGEIGFKIYSETDGKKEEILIHSCGKIMPCELEEAPEIDLEIVKTACNRSIPAADLYNRILKAGGSDYGPAFIGVESLRIGKDEALAKLMLPASAGNDSDKYVLHPGLMTSAVQASAAFISERNGVPLTDPLTPVELQQLRIFDNCGSEIWAYIRYREDCRFDIDLCDVHGKVCIRMKSCLLDNPVYEPVLNGDLNTVSTLILEPCWEEADVVSDRGSMPEYAEHIVFLCGLGEISTAYIENQMDGVSAFGKF
jgi:polyketide synthase PksN